MAEFAACRGRTEPDARLACFDAAAAKLATATANRDLIVLDRQDVVETRRSLFGFSLPRIALFGGRDGARDPAAVAREDIAELDTTITRVQSLGNGKYQLTLAEGGTWRSTEPWTGAKLPEAGSKINVRRASLGSYIFKLPGGRAVRGMRVG
ncbi:hypothetical protein ACFSGX_00260 [Sphingomonas arantia]|uniref:Lipoprotein n=1 Tax=Sphingomonas arantia TaxID=1460676 RepID=A0ABW4TTU4_9SPHN